MMPWPIRKDDIDAARARLAPHLPPTPLRHYPALDSIVGHGIRVLVKHENHQPTNSFKVRNGLSAILATSEEQRERGFIAATKGNHGQGVAYAGAKVGVPVTICVPLGNSPAKNRAMRDLGAELIEEGRDYDESVAVAHRVRDTRGLYMVHSTNDATVIAGAATITAEIIEQEPSIDAMVVAVGGGSQCVGALSVLRYTSPNTSVYAVQAANASAIHDSWHAGERRTTETAHTFADGLATRTTYAMTFPTLQAGLAGFVTASEAELAQAVRDLFDATHNLAEGAGAAGLAGLCKLAPKLAGKTVAIVVSGGNLDREVFRQILNETI